jgi:peptidoglycan/xylan/chitin deacetylase (PgdA/CDA1 family)
MPSQFLLRFDDFCPTMNWPVWHQLEQILMDADVKPILSVIPDNRDSAFYCAAPHADFWERVRAWQARGWTIGLHGYQHIYHTASSGALGIHSGSEFAGLPLAEQAEKIERGLEIFRREAIEPKVWVAPGHSFDHLTLEALAGAGLRCISDGFSPFPYEDDAGLFWIPQQMWRFRRMPFGLWTICMHPNNWSDASLGRFSANISKYRDRIVSFDAVVDRYRGRKRTSADHVLGLLWAGALDLKLRPSRISS